MKLIPFIHESCFGETEIERCSSYRVVVWRAWSCLPLLGLCVGRVLVVVPAVIATTPIAPPPSSSTIPVGVDTHYHNNPLMRRVA